MDFLVSVKDERSHFVKELLNNLKGVKAKELTPENKELMKDIIVAVEEVKLIKAGKKKGRPLEDLLNEL